MTAAAPDLSEAYAFCEERLKADDRTAWLADLFVPADKRSAFHALDAFALDIAGIRGKVREPLAGELRLQWWTDAIEGEARGDVRGHPVAAALLDTVRRFRLSRASLTDLLEAKRDDLYDDPLATLADYAARADRTRGALLTLKTDIMLGRRDPAAETAARHAGRALAVLDTIRALSHPATPLHMTLPLDLLKHQGIGAAEVLVRKPTPPVRAALKALGDFAEAEIAALRASKLFDWAEAGAAVLPASLVVPTLAWALKPKRDPFTSSGDLPAWRRQWVLWRAAKRNGKP